MLLFKIMFIILRGFYVVGEERRVVGGFFWYVLRKSEVVGGGVAWRCVAWLGLALLFYVLSSKVRW